MRFKFLFLKLFINYENHLNEYSWKFKSKLLTQGLIRLTMVRTLFD